MRKLGFKDESRWDVVGAPSEWKFDTAPDATGRIERGHVDVLLLFVRAAAELDAQVVALVDRIRPAGALWVLWPRKAAGHISGVTENYLHEVVLPLGLVDVKVAAVHTDWSGLKIVWRRENR